MPRPEVLERIKSAEEEADEIVALAQNDRDERIAEARKRAEEIRTEAEQEARDLKERRLEEAREEIDAESERVLEDGEQKAVSTQQLSPPGWMQRLYPDHSPARSLAMFDRHCSNPSSQSALASI